MTRKLLVRLSAFILAALLIVPTSLLVPGEGLTALAAETEKLIAWNEPAIPADAGKKIDLSDYSLGISATVKKTASQLTWSREGNTVTEFTPEVAGVYTLTATYDGGSKNVYVVAKNASDTEYVLYFNDFSSEAALSALELQKAYTSRYTVSDGKLHIDAVGAEMTRVLLPEWLGEFGNYRIDASIATSDELNTSRWCSIMYRVNGATADAPHPYYHMCVRKNANASSGVEYAMRTASNAWNVITAGSYTSALVSNKFYTYTVRIKDKSVLYSIDGTDIVCNENVSEYSVGRIGLQANYMKMHIDSVKVTLQLETPEFDVPETLIENKLTVDNIMNPVTNVIDIAKASDISKLSDAVSAIVYTNGTELQARDGSSLGKLSDIYTILGDNVIPLVYCKNNDQAGKALTALLTRAVTDAAIVSSNPAVVKYARTKSASKIRGIIDFRGSYNAPLTDEDIAEIRLAVNGNLAKTAIVDARCLSQSITEKMRALLLSVWAYTEADTAGDAAAAIALGAHGVVSPNPDNVSAVFSVFASNAMTRTPLVIGHRGNPSQAPENSMASYRAAYNNGADVVETDIYLSADNEIVIMHDGTIDRTTNGSGSIESMTLEKLKTYRVWGDNDAFKNTFPNETIPTLKELFDFVKGKDLKIFIEIKSGKTAICKKLADLIHEYDIADQVCVISFTATQLKGLQTYAPEISCGLLGSVAASTTKKVAYNAMYTALSSILTYNTTLNPSYSGISKELAIVANDRGVTIWPWTYSTGAATQFNNAFVYGYNGLTTNDAQYTKATVKSISTTLTDKVIAVGDTVDFTVTAHTYGRTDKSINAGAKATFVSGEDVVSVSSGKLTALKEGKAELMLRYYTTLPNGTAYTLYTELITVNVVADGTKAAEFALNRLSPLKMDENLVTNVLPGTTVAELTANFTNQHIRVLINEIYATDDDIVTTGCVIRTYNDGMAYDLRTVAVKGDTNCNGDVDSMDFITLRLSLLGLKTLDAAQEAAADINDDGAKNVSDYILLRLHLLGITPITQ